MSRYILEDTITFPLDYKPLTLSHGCNVRCSFNERTISVADSMKVSQSITTSLPKSAYGDLDLFYCFLKGNDLIRKGSKCDIKKDNYNAFHRRSLYPQEFKITILFNISGSGPFRKILDPYGYYYTVNDIDTETIIFD